MGVDARNGNATRIGAPGFAAFARESAACGGPAAVSGNAMVAREPEAVALAAVGGPVTDAAFAR